MDTELYVDVFDNSECRYSNKDQILIDKVSGIVRHQIEFVTPQSREQLQLLIIEANRKGTPISIISGGRNWGYGGPLPVQNATKVVSLRKLDRIISFDPVSGVLHIEAGVTQGQLEKYLVQHNYNYYVPTTGAGPYGSIIGNALERGFGMAPIEDHANSLLAINGFLPDGRAYTPALSEVDAQLSACFPYGIGPNLDKLATQSPWIIVTDAKIQLVKRSGHHRLFLVPFASSEWEQIVHFLQQMGQRQDLPIGSFKIVHQRQVELSAPLPNTLKKWLGQKEWSLLFTLRCENSLAQPIQSELQRMLNLSKLHATTWTYSKLKIAKQILSWLPSGRFKTLRTALQDLHEFCRLSDGWTSQVGLNVRPKEKGLVWLSPLCPLKFERVSRLLELIRLWDQGSILTARTWTWSVLNSRTMVLVMPMTFSLETQQNEVWECYHQKLEQLRIEGFVPYRLPIESMDFITQKVAPNYFKTVQLLTDVLDPHRIINAGRYG